MVDSPTIAAVIRNAIDARLVDLHTSMPGKVVSYDASTQTADIQPQLKRVVRDAAGKRVAEELPVIPCVPVQWPSGGSFYLHMPLTKGDYGALMFSEYSIDQWRSQGEQVDPGDSRRHGLSGAQFIPGVNPSAKTLSSPSGSDATLGVPGGGKFLIGSGGASEAMLLGTSFASAMSTYLSAVGAAAAARSAAWLALAANVDLAIDPLVVSTTTAASDADLLLQTQATALSARLIPADLLSLKVMGE